MAQTWLVLVKQILFNDFHIEVKHLYSMYYLSQPEHFKLKMIPLSFQK